MATEKNKRVVQIEIDDQVKKLTVEGVDKDAQVVMREELSNDELDGVAGGFIAAGRCKGYRPNDCLTNCQRVII
jgi:hypothetical protein